MKQSLRSQPLKLAAIDIPFDLRILGSRFVAGKPITKGRKLTLAESLYSFFDGFYCAHAPILPQKINRSISYVDTVLLERDTCHYASQLQLKLPT